MTTLLLPLSLALSSLALSSLALAAPARAEAPLPTIELAWRTGLGNLSVQLPPGEHLAPEAPATVWLEQGELRLDWQGDGAALARGVHVDLVPGEVAAGLKASLCQDAGTSCRWVELSVHGQLGGAHGRLRLAGEPVLADSSPAHADPARDFAADPDAAVAQAQAQARDSGGRVLVDFGAAWCPPCNLMAAQVLHDPAHAVDLRGFTLVTVDVDRPDSWTLKDRYHVGGYPTLVAIDPDGHELSRVVGYDSEGPLVAWLEAVRGGLDEGAAATPTTPAQAAARAWDLARQGKEDEARAALALALVDPGQLEQPSLRRARLVLSPSAEDLRWLLAHDLGRPEDVSAWLFSGLDLAQADPALADAVRSAIATLLPQASPAQGADLLWALAQLAPAGPEQQALYGAAAASLGRVITGDLHRDRGYLVFRAELLAGAGDLPAALDLLQAAVATWPDDFTFHHALAGTLLEAGQAAAAEAPARAALACSYGDNRLRAAATLARVLQALDRPGEARQVVDTALAEAHRPEEGLDVRTPRYLGALEKLQATLAP